MAYRVGYLVQGIGKVRQVTSPSSERGLGTHPCSKPRPPPRHPPSPLPTAILHGGSNLRLRAGLAYMGGTVLSGLWVKGGQARASEQFTSPSSPTAPQAM